MSLLAMHEGFCVILIRCLLTLALAIDNWRRRVGRFSRKLSGSLQKLRRRYLANHGRAAPHPVRRRAHNRMPDDVEKQVVGLHVGWPNLGALQLRHVVFRVLGKTIARETIRNILLRNQPLIAALESGQRRAPRKITVSGPRHLWGMDLTLVWVLGFFPVWVLGIIDYWGSNLVALEPLSWPTAALVVRVTEQAMERVGVPQRIMTDRGSVFRSKMFEASLLNHGVEHTLTRPCHPWTNGRIERLFRTFKETVRQCFWLVRSPRQWATICADFLVFYNNHRPHSAFGGRTPTEVYIGRPAQPGSLGAIQLFEGRLRWWRFL